MINTYMCAHKGPNSFGSNLGPNNQLDIPPELGLWVLANPNLITRVEDQDLTG